MKKMNLNLIKSLTPKQIKISAIVAGCICIILLVIVLWSCGDKEEIFTPSEYEVEELETEIQLSVEDDDKNDKAYGMPLQINETEVTVEKEE